jgi:hypothetical protein
MPELKVLRRGVLLTAYALLVAGRVMVVHTEGEGSGFLILGSNNLVPAGSGQLIG